MRVVLKTINHEFWKLTSKCEINEERYKF
jgi:hypothetical protein